MERPFYYLVSTALLCAILLTWYFLRRSGRRTALPDSPGTSLRPDEALDYFIGTYKDMAATVARSIIKDRRLAEETVQEALMAAWKIVPFFKDRSSFRAALYRLVMKEACIRLNSTRKCCLDRNMDENILIEKAFLSLKKTEQCSFITEALKKIPPHEPLMLRLFSLQEKGNGSFPAYRTDPMIRQPGEKYISRGIDTRPPAFPLVQDKKRAGNLSMPASFVTM